jgi:hypothetical protein
VQRTRAVVARPRPALAAARVLQEGEPRCESHSVTPPRPEEFREWFANVTPGRSAKLELRRPDMGGMVGRWGGWQGSGGGQGQCGAELASQGIGPRFRSRPGPWTGRIERKGAADDGRVARDEKRTEAHRQRDVSERSARAAPLLQHRSWPLNAASPALLRLAPKPNKRKRKRTTLFAEHHRPQMSVTLGRPRGCGVQKIRARRASEGVGRGPT